MPIITDLELNCSDLIYLSLFKVDLKLRSTFFAGRFLRVGTGHSDGERGLLFGTRRGRIEATDEAGTVPSPLC